MTKIVPTINISHPLLKIDGSAMTNGNSGEPLTYGSAILMALTEYNPANLSGAEKFKRWRLANKIAASLEVEKNSPPGQYVGVDFSIDEIKIMKDVVGEALPISAVGPIWTALDPIGN